MSILARAGINIYNHHNVTKSNALHVAVQRNHYYIARMLAESNYEMNHLMQGNLSALIIAAKDKKALNTIRFMIHSGADVNVISDFGQTALSVCVENNDRHLAELLLNYGANMFIQGDFKDKSPFF